MTTGRFFSFGCSFTQYGWPTWADILGRQFDYYQNWGQSGAGNLFISAAVSECNVKQNLTEGDTVAIMWTNVCREDRYHDHGWTTIGNVFSSGDTFDKKWIKKFADIRGYFIRDLAMISLVKGFLESKKINYYFLSMQDLWIPIDLDTDTDPYDISDVQWHYQNINADWKPSVHSVIFNNDWYSRPCNILPRSAIPNAISKYKFKFNPRLIRQDTHPSPAEHLEYLDKVLPEVSIDQTTRDWINDLTIKLEDPEFDITCEWKLDAHLPVRL